MKVLFIAPFPPPLTGNSLPVKILFEHLEGKNKVGLVNTSKSVQETGAVSRQRLAKIASVLWSVWTRHKDYDIVYLTVAESFAGNLRDMALYLICHARAKTMVIHMLGGSCMKDILNENKGLRYRLNRYFIGRVGAIVVEGKTQFDMFARVADPGKIAIIPNFAQDYLFASEDEVLEKFKSTEPLRVLFLSNMLEGKGHIELLQSYLRLEAGVKKGVVVDFAGAFPSEKDERRFLEAMQGEPNLKYHGTVSGVYKRDLFMKAHVFCLPTYYRGEGQPFSILEAYATGCVVVTTNHSGIGDVFRDRINGYVVEKKSVDALADTMAGIFRQKGGLCSMAVNNLRLARQNYTQSKYVESMMAVFEPLAPGHSSA